MTPFPLPLYALNAKVRYKPYYRHVHWETDWHPQPWCIVGIEVTAKLHQYDIVQYFIEPWAISGEWFVDRPMKICENMVSAWPEENILNA